MAEYKVEESYRVFSSLRAKFSGPVPTKTAKDSSTHPQQGRSASGKRRHSSYETRAATLPLVPLVEEGDQLQGELYLIDQRLAKLSAKVSLLTACLLAPRRWAGLGVQSGT